MREAERHRAIRAAARAYEEALPSRQRKCLGQFFTGLPLGKLLAHLALRPDIRTVLDPMAGNGDLLDAVWQAATERNIRLDQLDGMEIDGPTAEICRSRLADILGSSDAPAQRIIAVNAFDPNSVASLARPSYDLVITNPPYVRYQARDPIGTKGTEARSGLIETIESHPSGPDKEIWKALAEGYSGLADLSVPAWLLAAFLVRPGGYLALVAPATWRSRDYADVVRYLLLRCFSLECIVEDKQPGWFSNALVRTHLIVARRLQPEDVLQPLGSRAQLSSAQWVQLAPESASESSLAGAAFKGTCPEAQLAAWVYKGCITAKVGIGTRLYDLNDEWASLKTRITRHSWYRKLEQSADDLPLFAGGTPRAQPIPDLFRDLFPGRSSPGTLITLKEAGIQVGQGLRTGCNPFFYVAACSEAAADSVLVQASALFDRRKFCVPAAALRPVLQRQSDTSCVADGHMPEGRVLDLRGWVLPEDAELVSKALATYGTRAETPPRTMPHELAAYVRVAATIPLEESKTEKRIPRLSAVSTNVRHPGNAQVTPRFWYMLPDFAPRHLPAAFVARINHELPWVECNLDPPILIDANFSTFWDPQNNWTRHALKALLNSVWCRAFMEALGTPLGGGALKLEATHLRQLRIPPMPDAAREELDTLGGQLGRNSVRVQSGIDEIVLDAVLSPLSHRNSLSKFANVIKDRAQNMRSARQRAVS